MRETFFDARRFPITGKVADVPAPDVFSSLRSKTGKKLVDNCFMCYKSISYTETKRTYWYNQLSSLSMVVKQSKRR